MIGHVGALWLFPVKGLRGLPVLAARIEPAGFAFDRRFMLVRRSDAGLEFVTQRDEPKLVRIRAELDGERVVLRGPSGATLLLPAQPIGLRADVTVWESTVPAIMCTEADAWLARETGMAVHLAWLPADVKRAVTSSFGHDGDVTSFADAFPYLFASSSSLEDLNARLPSPITMERFRPNVVVTGTPAWDEDQWATVSVGEARFAARKPCDRCVVTTVDPETGETGKEPLKTLASFRKREASVYFGISCVAEDSIGKTIRVGDPVGVIYRSL